MIAIFVIFTIFLRKNEDLKPSTLKRKRVLKRCICLPKRGKIITLTLPGRSIIHAYICVLLSGWYVEVPVVSCQGMLKNKEGR
jgi:hypothetical protein